MQRTPPPPMFYGAKPIIFERARVLRKNMTVAEKKLWNRLNSSQLGVRFKRQHPIAIFIADFFCHTYKLVVEVDGEYHKTQLDYDEGRTAELENLGITVIRFTNDEVMSDIDRVVEEIKKIVTPKPPKGGQLPLQGVGGGNKKQDDTNKRQMTNNKIAIIGQGYVGLPLAIEFAVHFPVIGFDISKNRVDKLNRGEDHTREADLDKLRNVLQLAKDNLVDDKHTIGYVASADPALLKQANIYIVTVPTPIDEFNAPDLRPLKRASEMIGKVIKKGDIVIYESTVFPGCTEEVCVPIIEETSGLVFNQDFFAGYSPERINPGDKINTLTTIVKVTSGSTPEIANEVDQLYKTIIKAGTHKAPSLKVAEASKAIENAQRDVNISFVNELALIFDRMNIDTADVLEAAGTKYNFLKFKPGLVGGHCISVDPYYLSHKAIQLGYHPDVILSGRRVNDKIGKFVADKVVKLMIQKDHKIKGSRALVMGITFKENCPDVRNTRVIDIYHELKEFGLCVDVYDPWADASEVKSEYGLDIMNKIDDSVIYNAVILAVAHSEFLSFDYQKVKQNNGVIFDTKAVLDRGVVDGRL